MSAPCASAVRSNDACRRMNWPNSAETVMFRALRSGTHGDDAELDRSFLVRNCGGGSESLSHTEFGFLQFEKHKKNTATCSLPCE